MRINGVGALVSGGASGLGEATARELIAAGATVTIMDLNADRGEVLVKELGDRARFAQADVCDAGQVAAAVERAAEGVTLRIVSNCAGIAWAERTVNRDNTPHSLEAFERVIRINLIGSFNVLRLGAARMATNEPLDDNERGVIVNTASVAAFDGQIGQIAYSASKGAIVGMTLPAARDLSGLGIRVAAIAPGTFETPMLASMPEPVKKSLGEAVPFPKRLGSPREYARLVRHIVENGFLNGEVIRLDGAIRMAPK